MVQRVVHHETRIVVRDDEGAGPLLQQGREHRETRLLLGCHITGRVLVSVAGPSAKTPTPPEASETAAATAATAAATLAAVRRKEARLVEIGADAAVEQPRSRIVGPAPGRSSSGGTCLRARR